MCKAEKFKITCRSYLSALAMAIVPTIKSSTLLIIIICIKFNILIARCHTFNESDKNTNSYYDDIDDIALKYEKRSQRRKEEMEDRRDKLLKQTDRESTRALNNIAERLDNMTNLISTLFRKYSRREPPNYPDAVEVRIGIYIKGESLLKSTWISKTVCGYI